ncbi:aspartate aminotransferase family protein [Bosea sp. BH3]|uniref:aspartate aminotransferase family protein n=1 Tax=Bosea sp. BH3 TaxID=2871701 RepID=UPI0021CB9079|nr:aspartate aminotransferase family protein [Bosea sp. BH3]MCU4181548.1 aspartate aminotransferase family protein [Bosea sp. BH3]
MMTESADTADRRRFAGSYAHRERALSHLPRGVSSTPRATQQPVPIVIERGEDAHVFDPDGNRFIDYALGYGPLILGHSPAAVMDAVRAELAKGLRTASVHRGEAELAELIADCVPSAEMTSFVSTGTEAIQLALRIARATTDRTKIIKFRANYHGWFDNVHVANAIGRDGASTVGQDPGATASITLVDWGDADALEAALDDSFAAVIAEPAAVNAGCFEPPPGFLERLRKATRKHGAMLIFDEVITGFRMALGGAQERYGVTPDITVLGKALGAGLPISAVSGTAAAMDVLASGKLMHRGTFNGNPLSIAAAIACLRVLREERATLYPRIDGYTARLCAHLNAESTRLGAKVNARQAGPAMQIFVSPEPVQTLADTAKADPKAILDFTGALLRRGVLTLPRGLCYLSSAHSAADMEATETAITAALESVSDRVAA